MTRSADNRFVDDRGRQDHIIEDNRKLTNISALENLRAVNGDVWIRDNERLEKPFSLRRLRRLANDRAKRSS